MKEWKECIEQERSTMRNELSTELWTTLRLEYKAMFDELRQWHHEFKAELVYIWSRL